MRLCSAIAGEGGGVRDERRGLSTIIGVGLLAPEPRVGHGDGVLDRRAGGEENPKVIPEGAAVQHLDGELDVFLLEKPEEAAVVLPRERDRVTLAGMVLEILPIHFQPESPVLEAERRVGGYAPVRVVD